MIVVSAALVLVALVLLIIGLDASITLVFAAIGVSIVSAVLMLIGIFARPAPVVPAATARADDSPEKPADRTPAKPADEVADFPLEASEASEADAAAAPASAEVTVVSGRPRYHVSTCVSVADEPEAEPLLLAEARELGFTPCGLCTPDAALTAETAPAAGVREDPTTADVRPRPAARTVLAVEATRTYHREGCDLADAGSASELTKVAAIRQGYLACSRCRP